MKTDRFSPASLRVAAAVLAGFLLVADHPMGSQSLTLRIKIPTVRGGSSSTSLAAALAAELSQVRDRFAKNRSELRAVQGPDGKPAYPREEVAALISRTGDDLDQAIAKARKSGMEPLRAWSDEEIRRIQEGLASAPRQAALSPPGRLSPRAAPGAVFASAASLRGLALPRLASTRTTAPPQDVVAAEESSRLLDQVGAVVGRLLFLAERDDLEVKLWVGSTPARRAQFSFWPQGSFKGSTPEPMIVKTDGKRDRVLRGLYAYRAAWGQGQVTQVIQYPAPAGAPLPRNASERLDLVNRSSFFCCEFDEQSCRHVNDEKECRP